MFRSLFLSFVLAFSGHLSAQGPAPTSSPSHDHADETVSLEHFVVTASAHRRQQAELAQATTVLADSDLLNRRAPTIGETLAGLPGLHSTWFGPGASRPIVRGFDAGRVQLLENGAGTSDASVFSPDHAVTVEPFLIDRVEVVRGPASLLYGGSAIGGVVNVLTRRIAQERPEHPLSGTVEILAGHAAHERSAGATFDATHSLASDSALVFHLDGFRRESDDVRIPGFAMSASHRAEEIEHALEHGESSPAFAHGRLPDSSTSAHGGAIGLTLVNDHGHLGLTRNTFATTYGVPGHAHEGDDSVRIDLHQRRWDLQGETTQSFGPFSGARLKFGHADYEHRELEGDEVGTVFRHRGHELRAELLHNDLGGLAGTWGLQSNYRKLHAMGDEAFLPPARTTQHALFAFEEFHRGGWTTEFGARHEWQDIGLRDGSRHSRSDRATSLSLGGVWNPVSGWTVAFSLIRAERMPNAQEYFADGPHVGTGRYALGHSDLSRERSLGAELSLRKRRGRVTGELTLFAHRFNHYIHETDTGLVAVESADGYDLLLAADAPDAEHALPVFAYTATDARFRGAEAEFLIHLHDESQHRLDWRVAADFTRASDAHGRPLPRIPAARFTTGLQWRWHNWNAGTEWQRTNSQPRVAPGEDPSASYELLQAHVTWCLPRGRHAWEFHIRGTNLTNTEARPHTSYLKHLAPLPGRNLTASLRYSF